MPNTSGGNGRKGTKGWKGQEGKDLSSGRALSGKGRRSADSVAAKGLQRREAVYRKTGERAVTKKNRPLPNELAACLPIVALSWQCRVVAADDGPELVYRPALV
jgi:hypothetical protein